MDASRRVRLHVRRAVHEPKGRMPEEIRTPRKFYSSLVQAVGEFRVALLAPPGKTLCPLRRLANIPEVLGAPGFQRVWCTGLLTRLVHRASNVFGALGI